MNVLIAVLCCAPAIFALPAPESQQIPNLVLHIETPKEDGSYSYNYETGNGIQAQEEGGLVKIENGKEEALYVHGSFSYVDPEGGSIALSYVADENGFQPLAEHLPVAPPVPSGILKALEYIALHPEEDNL